MTIILPGPLEAALTLWWIVGYVVAGDQRERYSSSWTSVDVTGRMKIRRHHFVANHLVYQKARLTPEELQFLRCFKRWSSSHVAEKLGVPKKTVVKWESGESKMPLAQERLFRIYISLDFIPHYSVRDTEGLGKGPPESAPFSLQRTKSGWKIVMAIEG